MLRRVRKHSRKLLAKKVYRLFIKNIIYKTKVLDFYADKYLERDTYRLFAMQKDLYSLDAKDSK